jgi:hypothetical protein
MQTNFFGRPLTTDAPFLSPNAETGFLQLKELGEVKIDLNNIGDCMEIRNSSNDTSVNSPSFVALQYTFKETIKEEPIIEQGYSLFYSLIFLNSLK